MPGQGRRGNASLAAGGREGSELPYPARAAEPALLAGFGRVIGRQEQDYTAVIELVFYNAHMMTSSGSDRLRYLEIAGAAARHAPG